MRITGLSTIRTETHGNLLWVEVHTADGLSGLGETFFSPLAVEAYLHETVAPLLIGADARAITRINQKLVRQPVGYASSGVEMRAASAVDIALWDLAGKRSDLPIHALVGGLARDDVRIYNTCAGPHYVKKPRGGDVESWFGLDAPRHPLDDLHAFEHDPAGLARSLLDEGISAMKIWPFDRAAFANGGTGITSAQIEEGLRPFRLIREAVGLQMDIAAELHALWDLTSARRIAAALEPFAPLWIEDPVRMDDVASLVVLARETRIPILACETLAPAAAFRPLIASGAAGIVSFDPGWCGGITQALEIVAMASAAQLPVAPHDCTGPIGFVAGTHLTLAAPTGFIQETVRAYLRGWYAEIATELPPIADGRLRPLAGPGLGTALSPAFLAAPHVRRRLSGKMPRTTSGQRRAS